MLRVVLFASLLAVTFAVHGTKNSQSWRKTDGETAKCAHNSADYRSSSEEVLPKEFSEAHMKFTLDLLKHPGYYENIMKNGVAFTNTISLGHFLAVLSNKVELPTENFAKLLRLPSNEKIVESYSRLWDNLEEDDVNMYPTSTVFTPMENKPVHPNMERLSTHKVNIKLDKNAHAAPILNHFVRVATQDEIENELVPKVPPFTESTEGVLMNTIHYSTEFRTPWTKLGKQRFTTPVEVAQVETYETSGVFPVLETSTYTAVAVPLDNHAHKHMIFVRTKNNLKDYFINGNIDEVFVNGPKTWPVKNVRLQVPHVNVTIAHGFSQLHDEKIQCYSTPSKPYHIQPIVQVVTFVLTEEDVTYAVANGVQVNSVPVKTTKNTVRDRHLQQPAGVKQALNNLKTKLETIAPLHDDVHSMAEVFMDKPFFTYFYDSTLGPWGFNAISHDFMGQHAEHGHEGTVRGPKHHDHPMDFTEETKVHRWNCEHE